MIWKQAVLFSDAEQGWTWAEKTVLGLPCVVRILLTLKRSGIEQVSLPSAADGISLKNLVEPFVGQKNLPHILWSDQTGLASDAPMLGVRGGFLFSPHLIRWFGEALKDSATGIARLTLQDQSPLLVSSWNAEIPQKETTEATVFEVPPDLFCRSVQELTEPEGDRALLETVGKPTDRLHVVEVRRRTFPVIRWLAVRGITPNQVTWAGFLAALFACVLIAQGSYLSGIVGAVLLYLSWVVDCMDGTLARLTFSESDFGRKLDTFLGHVTNLCIFSALIWAVYGHESLWKAAVFAFFILGGIMMAYRVTEEKNKLPRKDEAKPAHEKLQKFLDKVNHRDYAVVIFILALLNGFKIFLWLSVVGIQVYWLLYYRLSQEQSRVQHSSGSPSH